MKVSEKKKHIALATFSFNSPPSSVALLTCQSLLSLCNVWNYSGTIQKREKEIKEKKKLYQCQGGIALLLLIMIIAEGIWSTLEANVDD